MSQAINESTTPRGAVALSPTRRHLLIGLSGTALVIVAPAARGELSDAELLALCAKMEALEDEYTRRSEDESIAFDDMWPAGYYDTVDLLEKTPAVTMEGLRAKARVTIGHFQPDDTPVDQALVWSLIRDVAGLEGAS